MAFQFAEGGGPKQIDWLSEEEGGEQRGHHHLRLNRVGTWRTRKKEEEETVQVKSRPGNRGERGLCGRGIEKSAWSVLVLGRERNAVQRVPYQSKRSWPAIKATEHNGAGGKSKSKSRTPTTHAEEK